MPSPPERSRVRLLAYGFLTLLAALAALPAYLALGPSWRPMALRVACALLVVSGCLHLVRRVRRAIEHDAPSSLEAPPPAPAPALLDERFVRARDDLVFSRRSRRYFDVILRPRLLGLGAAALPAPTERRRRGPSWRTLERLITEAESRS